ncbi:lectin-like domain-containing protein [Hymenobacter crusticola]|uniref:Secretion system C-terminal sorting domain-containing protein n=1 Tax=Hymenobacter crusticola TaxID=1770526 RepID=A0A243WH95_9BACT|nr:T9SS type A sorting domain-containing protein [Hymenobacter crusticola]OUJ74877.1 hypothetical protein BXP70_09000 [Hymenobacter crusticola]
MFFSTSGRKLAFISTLLGLSVVGNATPAVGPTELVAVPQSDSQRNSATLFWLPPGDTDYQFNKTARANTSCSGVGSSFTINPINDGNDGSVWRKQLVSLNTSFTVQFNAYFGSRGGSDGMTFALQRDVAGTSLAAGGGQNLGIGGATPVLAVEFDTYNNGTTVNDIAQDHLAIFEINQSRSKDINKPVAGPVQAYANGAKITDGKYHPVKIVWTKGTQTLQVYFDGATTPHLTYTENNLVNNLFAGNPMVYWGFTASSGTLYGEEHSICNLTFTLDSDDDGYLDTVDLDDDNDGIADVIEASNVDATGDADNDGIVNYQDSDFGPLNAYSVVASLDLDGDGLINQLDLDADNDGITDALEASGGQTPAALAASQNYQRTGTEAGRLTNSVDTQGRPQNSASTASPVLDTDNDGKPDFLDTNADGDAFLDWSEGFDDNSNGKSQDDYQTRAAAFSGVATYYPWTNLNSQGLPAWLQDANNNRYPDFLDVTSSYYHDTDKDGLVDLMDPTNGGNDYAAVSNIPDANKNNLTDYRDAAAATPLPVELVSFDVRVSGKQARLSWITASEHNSAYFAIETSRDGLTFATTGQVAAQGTSSTQYAYQYLDPLFTSHEGATVYYRLRQVDKDETTTYSPIRALATQAKASTTAVQAYPSPFATSLTVIVQAEQTELAVLRLVNTTGHQLLQRTITLEPGTNTFSLPEAARWPAGLYLLEVQQGAHREQRRIVHE